MDTTNLKRRGQTWFARVAVPRPQRPLLGGKSEVLRSLKTTSLAEARRLRHRVVHELQEEINRAVLSAQVSPGTAEWVAEAARESRAAVLNGSMDEESAQSALDATVEQFMEIKAQQLGVDNDGDPTLSDAETRAIQLAHKLFSGQKTALLADQIRAHLAEEKPRITAGALDDKRRRLEAFARWAGNIEVSTITRNLAGRYVQEVIQTSGLEPKSRRKWLSWLNAFGDYLETYRYVEVNPFVNLGKRMKESTRGGVKKKRRPWTPEEYQGLISKLPAGSPLLPMALISGYSAMRIDEVANMRLEHVTNDAFRIVAGKTGNSVRVIPMHPVLMPIVERLRQTSDDGYLISGLLPGGRDNKRSHFPSKYFGRFIRANGFSDPLLNFHGLRRSWTQRAETAKVPQSTCNLIDGHARQNLSYGLYSDGPDWPVLVEAMEKVAYGNACDDLAKRRAADCHVTERMKRRRLKKPPS
jgi:integrase